MEARDRHLTLAFAVGIVLALSFAVPAVVERSIEASTGAVHAEARH